MLSILLLLAVGGTLATADTLVIPAHSQYSLPVEFPESSVISDAELAGELEYMEFQTDRALSQGVQFDCTNCPYAVIDNDSEKGYRWVPGYSTELDLSWSVEDKAVHLNHHALLDSNMQDLHKPQTTAQEQYSYIDLGYYDELQSYGYPLPITYNVRVVQTKTVRLEDGSFAHLGNDSTVQFYSIDFEILSIDDQDLTSLGLPKTNIHIVKRADGELAVLPFTNVFPSSDFEPTVSTTDSDTDEGSSSTLAIPTYAQLTYTGDASDAYSSTVPSSFTFALPTYAQITYTDPVSNESYSTISSSSTSALPTYAQITYTVSAGEEINSTTRSTTSAVPVITASISSIPSGTNSSANGTIYTSATPTSQLSPTSSPFTASASPLTSCLPIALSLSVALSSLGLVFFSL